MGKAKVVMSRIKRKYIKVIAIVATAVGIFAVISYVSITSRTKASETKPAFEWYYDDTYKDNELEYDNTKDENGLPSNSGSTVVDMNDREEEIDFTNVTLDTNPESITVLVNKELPLPEDYVPSDLTVPNVLFNFPYFDEKKQMRKEAAIALEDLFQAASNEGLELYAISGYRSYKRQYEIFTNNVKIKGLDHTSKYSAIPGYSEHQTGLSMDVSTKSMRYRLEAPFAETGEGIWLSENAHRFGYIIRFPEGKSEITGYSYEPWHIRYVGVNLATYLYENALTLEEFYKFTPSMDYKDVISYDNLIDYGIDLDDVIPTKAPTITPTPIEEELEGDDLEGDGLEDEELEDDGLEGDDSKEDSKDKGKGDKDKNKDKDKGKDKDKDKDKGEAITTTPTPSLTPEVTKEPTITPTPTDSNEKEEEITPSITPTIEPTMPEVTITPDITPTP